MTAMAIGVAIVVLAGPPSIAIALAMPVPSEVWTAAGYRKGVWIGMFFDWPLGVALVSA